MSSRSISTASTCWSTVPFAFRACSIWETGSAAACAEAAVAVTAVSAAATRRAAEVFMVRWYPGTVGRCPPVSSRSAHNRGGYAHRVTALDELRAEARDCKACPLWQTGTQTVFGEGSADARVLFVGEQPGDQEDRAGRPFVGPAGRVLDEALELAGIDRSTTYVTNAVKHFKWQARGKRRIHAKPTWSEQMACRPWLEAELEAVQPRVLVCLGATAGQSLLGKQFRVTKERGRWLDSDLAEYVTATIHPSSILRQRDDESRHAELDGFVQDLRLVATVL